tara:strand:- start:2305 stop:6054 length:3750 start_codon:yes stop_codon:yes gene_type:complete
MAADEPDDKIIRERKFKRSFDIDIGDIEASRAEKEQTKEEADEALGEIFDPFSERGADSPGSVRIDGTVDSPPENDIVTHFSIEGDRRISWILMGSMIVLYSAISIQVGRTFDPIPGTLVLVLLASLGFVLGEIWVPKERMSLLGVTWVIISMKVLYGLALELRHWGLIGEDLYLGVVLLFLVAVNVYVAYRHDHDAIAAQSTLVLLAIGSTAGTEFGESGVAVMILIATIMLHGIAINRNSGNLASLGIAASNLWIGMHAATSGFEIGQLRVLPLETPLLLFLLLMAVTGLNAIMAAKFAKEENWFSKGFETLGLGKPGLWGVSISLGMVGAFMVVASYREDLGYALGIVTFLGGAFGGSYLAVRGVDPWRVAGPLLASGSILTIVLLSSEAVEESLGISAYEIFTVLGAFSTGLVILRDQESVTDRVLWTSSIVVLAILVLLVPAGSSSEYDGGLVLLGALSALHLGTAALAIKRSSPSLSGITVLLPWGWLLIEGLLEEIFRTVMLANDVSDWGGYVDLSPAPLAVYLSLSSILLFVVNVRAGEGVVNLASGFMGITEISSSIRDSGALNLWSIGLWLPMITILFLAQFGGFTTVSIVSVLSILVGVHIFGKILGYRKGRSNGMLIILAFTCLAIQWRHGLDEAMIVLLCVSITSLLYFGDEEEFGLGLGIMSMPLIVSMARKKTADVLDTPSWYTQSWVGSFGPEVEFFALACTAAILSVYLPRAEKMDNMLKPAGSALLLLVVTNILALDSEVVLVKSLSVAMFAISSFWLISRGEIRSELRSVALRDAIVSSTLGNGSSGESFGISGSNQVLDSNLATYNPKIAEMSQKRKTSREKSETGDMAELLTSDLSHTPVIGLFVIGIVMSTAVVVSAMGDGVLVLIAAGSFSCLVVLMIRNRTRGLEIDLPHILGMEMPIALTISGICLALATAHIIPVDSSPDELLDMAVASVLILVLTLISLLHQKNLLDRIEIAVDWFVFPILAARLVAAVVLGGIPFPLTVDPFEGDFVDSTVPWVLLESLLVLCVIVYYWAYEKSAQLERDAPDGVGIGARSLAIVMLSFGPAGLLAAANASYRSIKTSQPSGLGIALPGAVLACLALAAWNNYLWDYIGGFLLVLGISLIVACALTVPLEQERWTITLATDGHIFAIAGAIYLGMIGGLDLPMLLVLMSTVVWVVGIIQLRKSLRIWGLGDLVAAVLCSFVFASSEIVQPEKLFLGMIVLAAELGIVAWLGLAKQEDMAKD